MIKPILTLEDILNAEENREYADMQDMLDRKPSKTEMTVSFDLERSIDKMFDKEPVLVEEFDSIGNLLLLADQKLNSEGVSSNDRVFSIDLGFELKDKESLKDKIDSVILLVNESISNIIDSTLGVNLENFIGKKNDEAQDSLSCDYSNAVSAIFYKKLRTMDGSSDLDTTLLINSTAFPKSFHPDADLVPAENATYSIPKARTGSYTRDVHVSEKHYQAILDSKFIKSYYQVQGNNASWLRLEANKTGVDLISKLREESIQEFRATPLQNSALIGDSESFVGHTNDGKGNHADIWKSKKDGEVYVVVGIDTYKSLDLIKEEKPALAEAVMGVLESVDNKNVKKKTSGLKR
jgi:hypothetical protein